MKFTKHAYHRKKKLKSRWRRPRGLHNKQRLEHKSATPRVKVGYRSPKDQRHKKNGLEIVQVYNAQDVQAVDKKTQGVVIGKVGMKKKIQLLELVKERGLTLHTGDAEEHIAALKERFEKRKQKRAEKQQERESKQEELESQAEEQPEESEEQRTPLSKVKGVGPSRIEKLEQAGIESAEQLAALTPGQLVEQSDVSEGVAQKLITAARNATKSEEDKEKEEVLKRGN